MLLIVGNKVLSPQYLIWLAPLVAVMLAIYFTRTTWLVSVLLLATTFLTLLVYPATYTQLTEGPSVLAAVILGARNVMLLALGAAVVRLFFNDAKLSPSTKTSRLSPQLSTPRVSQL